MRWLPQSPGRSAPADRWSKLLHSALRPPLENLRRLDTGRLDPAVVEQLAREVQVETL